MRIKFESCPMCSRPLHRTPCDACSVSHKSKTDNRGYNEKILGQIADMVWKAYEAGSKMSLQLTRARM